MHELNRISLRGLRAVECVARLGSLTRAADEMGVSSGAVSQQITAVEAALGIVIFRREHRGMVVTPRAEELCSFLAAGFSHLSRAVLLAEGQRDGRLTVSVAPIFASRWLIWRLPAFQKANPNLKIRLDAAVDLVDPRYDDIDVCVRVGRGNWPNVLAEKLFPQIVFPVCSPEVADRLRTVSDLRHVPIIRDANNSTYGWDAWLRPGELDEASLSQGPVFSDGSLCLDAAVSGSGVFLTFETLAVDALSNGRLVEPFGRRRATENAYWVILKPGRPRPPTQSFRSWLKEEIAAARLGYERDDMGQPLNSFAYDPDDRG